LREQISTSSKYFFGYKAIQSIEDLGYVQKVFVKQAIEQQSSIQSAFLIVFQILLDSPLSF
jgi:hypothetical protein